MKNGLKNFFGIFEPIVDEWMFIDNSGEPYEIIGWKNSNGEILKNVDKWNCLLRMYKSDKYGQ